MNGLRDLLGRRDGHQPTNGDDAGERPAPRLRPRETQAPPPVAPSRARRFLQPMPLVGVALVLVALVGFLAVYSSTTDRTPVLVTARDLAAGDVLQARDVRVAELAGDRTVIAGLVPEPQLDAVLGRRLSGSLAAGTPLTAGAVAEQPAQTAITLELPSARALDGALQAGDRVSVLATFDAGSGGALTRPVARNLTVLAVGGARQPGVQTTAVTVALADPSIASRLALANDDARLNLLREGEQAATDPIPPARTPGR